MLAIFILSLKIRIIYVMNNCIYALKQIPIIGKKIPSNCYSNKALKIIGTILAVLKEIIWQFLIKKTFYFLIFFIGIPVLTQALKQGSENVDGPLAVAFTNIFIFLSIIGGFLMNDMFVTDKDKYYAIFTMRINAKKYVISNYIYNLIKLAVMFVPFVLLFGAYSKQQISTKMLLLLPLININIKIFIADIKIKYFQKTKKPDFENSIKGLTYIIMICAFVLAYLLPILGVEITQLALFIIFSISSILGIYSFISICKFNNYKIMYKKLFAKEKAIKLKAQYMK